MGHYPGVSSAHYPLFSGSPGEEEVIDFVGPVPGSLIGDLCVVSSIHVPIPCTLRTNNVVCSVIPMIQ